MPSNSNDTNMINEIIATLEKIALNTNDAPLHILGGYIVGATIVRDDIETLYDIYPELEIIAELGAELETIEDPATAAPVFEEFKHRLAQFKVTLP